MSGAEPETKYFLIRFMMKYEFDKCAPLTVKEAVESFRMSDRSVTKAISFLVKNNYLDRLRAEPGHAGFSASANSKGRPKSVYRPGAALLALSEEWALAGSADLHGEKIDSLLIDGLSTPKKVVSKEGGSQ